MVTEQQSTLNPPHTLNQPKANPKPIRANQPTIDRNLQPPRIQIKGAEIGRCPGKGKHKRERDLHLTMSLFSADDVRPIFFRATNWLPPRGSSPTGRGGRTRGPAHGPCPDEGEGFDPFGFSLRATTLSDEHGSSLDPFGRLGCI